MTTLLQMGRSGESVTGIEVLDMHVHLGPYYLLHGQKDSAETLIQTMDRLGVTQAVCCSLPCIGSWMQVGNDLIRDAMHAHPGRILGYMSVWPTSASEVAVQAERRLGEGFTGVKLHVLNGFDYTDPAYEPLFRMADERRMPVLMHTYGDQPGLDKIPELASRYKNASLVLGHAGVRQIEDYIRIGNDYENTYLEVCTCMCPRRVVERLLETVPLERILWGSDALFLNMPQQLGKLLGADIPEDAKRRILSTNAKRVLSQIRKA